MLKKELADALGISAAMVSKLVKRGMPTDSVERAQRWRRRHLEPGRVKGVRYERNRPAAPDAVRHADALAPASLDPVRYAEVLGLVALDDFATHGRALRLALQAVPEDRADEVRLPEQVWAALYGPEFMRAMEAQRQADPPAQGEAMTPEEEDAEERLQWDVLTGRRVVLPAPSP